MEHSENENSIRQHFQLKLSEIDSLVDPGCSYYLLLCSTARVTIRSQQTRAINLAWALRQELGRESTTVAVIGGGAAGITFAAAAAMLGASVQLFERSKLMHLQVGSWHRPLHPEIYTWPEDTAYRPVSHLPLLGWTTGTAHDVATEIVSKFQILKEHSQKVAGEKRPSRLQVHEGERATLTSAGKLRVGDEEREFKIIVLAVGFGVEDSLIDQPLNSYWRADALDQSFLGEDKPTVVVSGAGDGALIEVLRSCVQETDQGPFLDKILALTLRDKALREAIKKIENEKGRDQVTDGYLNLSAADYPCLREVDEFLEQKKRDISVKWLYQQRHPFESPSWPINRFLVSRLMIQKEKFALDPCPNTQIESVSRIGGGRFLVEHNRGGSKQEPIRCQQAIIRWGTKKYETVPLEYRKYSDLLQSVASVFASPTPKILTCLNEFLKKGKDKAEVHEKCYLPWGWQNDAEFKALLEPRAPKSPTLMAEFIAAFDAPDLVRQDAPKMVYRIRIWLLGVSKDLTIRYDLHPEEDNMSVSRVGIGHYQNERWLNEQWLNTRNDYRIRVRTSDGFEWNVGFVLDAVRRRYELSEPEEKGRGADPRARQLEVWKKRDDGSLEKIGEQSSEEALKTLEGQTQAMKALEARTQDDT